MLVSFWQARLSYTKGKIAIKISLLIKENWWKQLPDPSYLLPNPSAISFWRSRSNICIFTCNYCTGSCPALVVFCISIVSPPLPIPIRKWLSRVLYRPLHTYDQNLDSPTADLYTDNWNWPQVSKNGIAFPRCKSQTHDEFCVSCDCFSSAL